MSTRRGKAPLVIVTRPSAAGQWLLDRLVERGHRAVWWPAFDIGPALDSDAARATLSRIADYDLALFVSANAVRAAKMFVGSDWPAGTVIGAVGGATRAAVDAELRPGARVTVVAPEVDDEAGSEAFWRAWQASGQKARRVLLLRAEDGREWLTQRFIETGAQVDAVAVYSRLPHRLSSDDLAQMRDCIDSAVVPVIIFSSSEAIATLDVQVGTAARAWLRGGKAVSTHPRIEEHLHAAGYPRVTSATFDEDSFIAKLESAVL